MFAIVDRKHDNRIGMSLDGQMLVFETREDADKRYENGFAEYSKHDPTADRQVVAVSVTAESGVLRHSYVNASDDIAAYCADQCGRQAVTVEFAFEKMDADETFYLFSYDNNDAGLDPWITIDGGIDPTGVPKKYVLCHGRTGEFEVQNDTRIFADRKAVDKALQGGK